VARVKKKPPPPKPAPQKPEPAKPEATPDKPVAAGQEKKPEGPEKLDLSNWQTFKFQDGSHISFPPDWKQTEVPAEKNMVYGIGLEVPDSEASLKCYSRTRQLGDDFPKTLKKILTKGSDVTIEEEKKQVGKLEVTELSGLLADKHMAFTVFDDLPDRYFIVSLIAADKEYEELQPYYRAIVASYGAADSSASVSIENIEQQLQQSIENDKEYLVGSVVKMKLKNGTKHKGLVVGENDYSYTLEAYRFGGKYSYKVMKRDIAEISK
jgi:hypothetical protein